MATKHSSDILDPHMPPKFQPEEQRLAGLLETSVSSSLIALGSARSPPYHQADEPKELKDLVKFLTEEL